MENVLSFHIQEKVYIIIILYSSSLGGEDIYISLINKYKQGMLYL